MINISFTIQGNHEDPEGNPVPYTRMLGNRMTSAGARYKDWQEYVRQSVLGIGKTLSIPAGHTCEIEMDVTWANEHHADLDNVGKGVIDALFQQDKEISRITLTAVHGTHGLVRGRILIYENGA